MTRYHYVTVNAHAFGNVCQMIDPVLPDAFISEDAHSRMVSRMVRDLVEKGYRFVAFVPDSSLALFEKVIT